MPHSWDKLTCFVIKSAIVQLQLLTPHTILNCTFRYLKVSVWKWLGRSWVLFQAALYFPHLPESKTVVRLSMLWIAHVRSKGLEYECMSHTISIIWNALKSPTSYGNNCKNGKSHHSYQMEEDGENKESRLRKKELLLNQRQTCKSPPPLRYEQEI